MAKRFTISLPDDLYNTVKEGAERDCRTLSREIEYLLRLRAISTSIPTPENPTGQAYTPTNYIGYKRTVID